MYCEDLSPYSYSSILPQCPILSVGWLEKPHPFPIGAVPSSFVPKLRQLIERGAINQMRGFHQCHFCQTPTDTMVRVAASPSDLSLGSAEVWVPAPNGTCIYAAPNLIFHYITAHQYLPPSGFIQAVELFDFSSDWDGNNELQIAEQRFNNNLVQRETDLQSAVAPLAEAIRTRNLLQVEAILTSGINPNPASEFDESPMEFVAALGDIELATLLHAHGAAVDSPFHHVRSPLMAASSQLRSSMVAFLLERGASPNRKGAFGHFPLLCALQSIKEPDQVSAYAQLECIRSLAEHGADINLQSDTDFTALMAAAQYGSLIGTLDLLRLGADTTLIDKTGRNAEAIAEAKGYTEIARVIREFKLR